MSVDCRYEGAEGGTKKTAELNELDLRPFGSLMVRVNRTRNGTCVNRVPLELWKEQSMY
jgi:hypothetical protein